MKQTFRGSLIGLFSKATTYQTKDVLTCCRTVVLLYISTVVWNCRFKPVSH
jgi:hypothetical protein